MVGKYWENGWLGLTHSHLERHGYVLSTVAADALVLKHQTISTLSADQVTIDMA